MQALFQKFLLKAAKQIRQPGLLGSLEYELTPQFVFQRTKIGAACFKSRNLSSAARQISTYTECLVCRKGIRHTRSVWFVEKEFDKPVTKNVNERSTRPKSLEP